MAAINQVRRYALLGIFLGSFLVLSCAPMPYLNVNYRLPGKADTLKGKTVFLTIQDTRGAKEILGRGARKQLKDFSGNISLSVARGTDPGFKVGVYEIDSFLKEVFKRRLEDAGIEVVSLRKEGQVEMVILIKDFLLDLVGRNWTVTMGYEARLVKDKRQLSTQGISGEAERVKLIGQREADRVLGEIFTDMVNRLDLGRMFQQAGL
jgi:hypothetical protein